MKKLISLTLIVCMVFSMISVLALSDVSNTNLALNKKAFASSELVDYEADKLTDGDVMTGWSVDGSGTQWAAVDLGKAYKINQVVIEMRKDYNQPETRCNFEVRASNSADMENYVVLGAQGSTPVEHAGQFVANVVGEMVYRYIQVIKTDSTYFFLSEILVYGEEASGDSFALEKAPEFTDIEDPKLNQKIQLLSILGIVDGYGDQTFRPEKKVTRVEACQFIVNLLKMNEQGAGKQIFADVPLTYWGAAPIEILSGIGSVNGMGDGTFLPEETVTYSQFLKMLISSMGYEPFAENGGGYPTGYLALASVYQIALANVASNELVTREMIVEMLYQALSAPLAQFAGVEEGNVIYQTDDNASLMYEVFDAYQLHGKVEATEYAALKGNARLAKGQVKINGQVYRTAMDTSKALGRMFNCYIQWNEDISEDVLIYMTPRDISDNLEIPADNILDSSDKFTLKYYESNADLNVKSVSIERPTDVYYNEAYLYDWDADTIRPECGFVRLTDSDGNGLYENVFVYEFETYVVSNIRESGEEVSIFGLYGNQLTFDMSDTSVRVRLTNKEGKQIHPSAIEPGDVASVYQDSTGSSIWVAVSGDRYEGTVDEITNDGIISGGREMKYSAAYMNALKNGSYGAKQASLGSKVVFLLDTDAKIAAISNTDELSQNTVLKYGYLVSIERKKGVDNTLNFLIADSSGKLKEYSSSQDIRLNGLTLTEDEMEAALSRTAHNGSYGQLVRYRADSEENISGIFTSDEISEENGIRIERPTATPGDIEYFYHAPTVGMYQVSGNGGADYFVSPQTLVFTVPKYVATASSDILNESNYSAAAGTSLSNYGHYYTEAYNCDEAGIAEVLINYITPTSADDGSDALTETYGPVLVVDSVVETINEDGEPVDKLYVYFEGEKKSYMLHENIDRNRFRFISAAGDTYHSLSRGDVIRCAETNGIITSAVIMFRSEDPMAMANGKNWDYESVYPPVTRTIGGVIKNIYGNYMEIAKGDPTSGIEFLETEKYQYTASEVYFYDRAKDKINVVNAMEIPLYTYSNDADIRVFLRTNLGAAKTVLLVKE